VLAFNKEIEWDADAIKCLLCTVSHTVDRLHDYKDHITNEVTGTGYTATGVALASKTLAYVAANSWAQTWVAATAYNIGDLVRPTTGNTHLYRCTVAGTSHAATEPTWPTANGGTVTDNTVTWDECGVGAIMWDAGDASWPNSTITARSAHIYDSTPGSDATRPLIAWINFGEDKSSSNGTFTVQFAPSGILVLPVY
jgi:hypothetical protein